MVNPFQKEKEKKQSKIARWFDRKIDDLNWEIAMFFKYGFDSDGVFATLLIPCLAAFVVSLIVTLLMR